MKISSKLYNVLKYISTIGIPALVTFMTVIGQALNLEWMPTVVMILSGFGVFLGALIGVSSKAFWKNWTIVTSVKEEEDGDVS